MTALTITRQAWAGKDQPTKTVVVTGPEVGSRVRFTAQPYYAGTLEVTAVEIVEGEYTGTRFHITGTVVEGTVRNRLFGAVSHDSAVGKVLELFCYGPASDGGWDYVFPV